MLHYRMCSLAVYSKDPLIDIGIIYESNMYINNSFCFWIISLVFVLHKYTLTTVYFSVNDKLCPFSVDILFIINKCNSVSCSLMYTVQISSSMR